MRMQRRPRVTLRVKDRGGGPVVYARFRSDGKNVELALGRGWLVPAGSDSAKANGKALGRGWVERKGRAPEGFLTPDAAWQLVPGTLDHYIEREEAEARSRLEGARVTLADGVERWLDVRRVDDPDGERDAWKHSHAKNMATYAHRFARELGADRYIDTFEEAELKKWLAEDLKPMRNGRVLKQPTTRKMRATYRQALAGFFAFALERGWADKDPTLGLPAYRTRKKRADDPLRREEYLTKAELRRVLVRLRMPSEDRKSAVDPEEDAVFILVMAFAGLRPGETDALRWQEIDFKAKSIRVVESHTMGVTDEPKSGSGRVVPMSGELAAALVSLRERRRHVRSADRVFVGPDGGHVDMPALRKRFKQAQAAAGISPPRDLRQMRNTFGTVCAAEGVPLRTLQGWMGHESITTTERYASFMPRDQDAAVVEAAFR